MFGGGVVIGVAVVVTVKVVHVAYIVNVSVVVARCCSSKCQRRDSLNINMKCKVN